MSTTFEETSDTPTSFSRLVFLIAFPAIALSLMAALALRQDEPRREPVARAVASGAGPVTPATVSPRNEEHFTLVIMSGPEAAQRPIDLGGTTLVADWYAYANTPDEEAELIKAWDHADWIRYESGLPLMRVIDLRSTPALIYQQPGTH